MIKGIGIDIIELERIKESIKKNERLVNRVLTEKEKNRYAALSSERRKVEFLAGRFAAKEACAKALGTGIGTLSFKYIEILNEESGAPKMMVKGYEMDSFLLSISHSQEFAVAQVLIQ